MNLGGQCAGETTDTFGQEADSLDLDISITPKLSFGE